MKSLLLNGTLHQKELTFFHNHADESQMLIEPNIQPTSWYVWDDLFQFELITAPVVKSHHCSQSVLTDAIRILQESVELVLSNGKSPSSKNIQKSLPIQDYAS